MKHMFQSIFIKYFERPLCTDENKLYIASSNDLAPALTWILEQSIWISSSFSVRFKDPEPLLSFIDASSIY